MSFWLGRGWRGFGGSDWGILTQRRKEAEERRGVRGLILTRRRRDAKKGLRGI